MYLFQFDPINILVKSKMTTNQEITCVIKKGSNPKWQIVKLFFI